MEYLPRYTREQARRHEVRPGVTGWAQLNGRNTLPWEDRFALDVWYVEHQSCRLDARILLLTVWKTLAQAGVSPPGEGPEEHFYGRETVADVPARDIEVAR
jgi:sugar transferase EpsL